MRLLLLTLLSVCCLTACTVEGVGSEALEKSICVSFTIQQLPVSRIKSYVIREGSIKAVIFITKRGLKVCADPEAKWVESAIKSVDNRSRVRRSTVPTGTQNSTSTSVTLSG